MSCSCKKAVNIFESASTPYRIGKTGENVYQEIEFNFSKWLSEYPNAKIDLLIRVPKNGFYLLAEGITESNYLWKPSAFDLANPGRAAVMARMSSGEVRAKSDPIPFEIVRSMDYNLDISEPGPTRPSLMDEWIEDIYEAAARYPKIGEDGYWYVWDVVEGDWKKTDTYAGGIEGKGGIVYIAASNDYKVPLSASEIIDLVNDGKYPILNFIGLNFQYSGVDNNESIFSATGIRRTNFIQSIQIRVHEDKTISYDTIEVGVKSVNGQTGEITKILSYAAQTLTESEKAQARRNIDAISVSDLGIVFTLKGSVATPNDLPVTGNRVGDVWYVESASVGFVWLTSTTNPNGYWEELGAPIDLSAYVDEETYAADMAQINTELQNKLTTTNLQAALDDDVGPARLVLVRNGNTITTVDKFINIANLLISTARRVMFGIVVSQSGGNVTYALELYPTMIDTNNRLLTLVGYFDGDRYTAELTAASASSTMTGTLVVEPIVTEQYVQTAVEEVTPFEIPFVKQSDESWVFDPNSTLTPIDIFNGIKNAQSGGGVVAKVVTPSGEMLFYRALDALAEDGEPEDNPAALAEFIEFPFGDNYYYLHYIQVNPYDPDSDYWIETESNRTDFAQSTYVDNRIEAALASTQTYYVRGIASAASLLTSSGTAVSYADLVRAQTENNSVEIKAAMFDLDYNAQFKISEFLFDSQVGKATVVLTDVTATQVVVVTLTGTGETGALTGTVTTTPIKDAPFEIEITESDSTFSTTATAQEILDNADNCVAVLRDGAEVIKPDFITRNGSTVVSILFTVGVVAAGLAFTQIAVTVANGNVTVVGNSARFTPLPDATSAIAGDFLRLDGQKQPVWQTLQTYQGGNY